MVNYNGRQVLVLYIGQPSAQKICDEIAKKLKLGEEEEVEYFLKHNSYKLD